jgi:hypothetical protein
LPVFYCYSTTGRLALGLFDHAKHYPNTLTSATLITTIFYSRSKPGLWIKQLDSGLQPHGLSGAFFSVYPLINPKSRGAPDDGGHLPNRMAFAKMPPN